MSQVDLAKKIGITKQRLSGWERGVSYPSNDHLDKLVRELGRSVSWLLTGSLLPDADTSLSRISPVGTPIPLYALNRVDQVDGVAPNRVLMLPFSFGDRSFAVEVIDDAMSGAEDGGLSFVAGSIVVIDPDRKVRPGDYLAVRLLADAINVIRRYVPAAHSVDRMVFPCKLAATNSVYPPILIEREEEVSLIGVVVCRIDAIGSVPRVVP